MKKAVVKVWLMVLLSWMVVFYNSSAIGQSSTNDDALEINAIGQPNDTFSEATEVIPGVYENLVCSDADWYKISLAKTTSLQITLFFSHSVNGNIDAYLYKKQEGNQNWEPTKANQQASSISQTDNEEFFLKVEPGTYYFKVVSSTPSKNNQYWMKIQNYDYQPQPCTYEWIGAPAGLAPLPITGDDDYGPADIGFPFSFYDLTTQQIYVSSNGYLTFDADQAVLCGNNNLISDSLPLDIIAPFWDDLDPRKGGNIYAWTEGVSPNRRFIALWDSIRPASNLLSNTSISFEVILLEETNEIIFQYLDVILQDHQDGHSFGQSASVGLRRSNIIRVLASRQYCFEEAKLNNGLAISFVPQSIGVVPPYIVSYEPFVQNPSLPSVSRTNKIRLIFSKSMNTNATEAAFSINPGCAGQIEWNNDQTIMEFAPAISFEGLTQYSVYLSQAAVDQDDLTLAQAFQFSFTTQEAVPPSLTNLSPAAGSTGVAKDTNISFSLLDDGQGIDLSSIKILVNNLEVTNSLGLSITGSPSGYQVIYNSPTDFAQGSTVSVKVLARDLATYPNNLDTAFSFSIESTGPIDLTKPNLYGQSPAQGEQVVLYNNSTVEVKFFLHDDSGVDPNSVIVWWKNQNITNSITIDSLDEQQHDLKITYSPTYLLQDGEIIQIIVQARDLSPTHNSLSDTFSFSVSMINVPTIVYDLFPDPNSSQVPVTSDIHLHIANQFFGLEIGSITLFVDGVNVTQSIDLQCDFQDCYLSYQPSPFAYDHQVSVRIVAQDLGTPPGVFDYSFVFTTESSPFNLSPQVKNFPLNYPVTALVYDMQDTLWVGTEGGGLYAYNTQTMSSSGQYTIEDGLSSNTISSLALDGHGHLWIGFIQNENDLGGLMKFNLQTQTIMTTYNTSLGNFPDDSVNDLAVDSNNVIWVATQSSGVVRVDGDLVDVFADSSNGLSEDWVQAIALNDTGVWWLGGSWQIYRVDEAMSITEIDSLISQAISVSSFFSDANNTLWVATRGGGIYRYGQDGSPSDPSRISTSLYPEIGTNIVYDLLTASQTYQTNPFTYWFATESGIRASSADLNTWTSFTAENSGLISDRVFCLAEDGAGNLWFGTDLGLTRIDLIEPGVSLRADGTDPLSVPITTNFYLEFSEPMDRQSVQTAINLRQVEGGSIPFTLAWDTTSHICTINPNANLSYATDYELLIDQSALDSASNPINSMASLIIRTQPAPPPPAKKKTKTTSSSNFGLYSGWNYAQGSLGNYYGAGLNLGLSSLSGLSGLSGLTNQNAFYPSITPLSTNTSVYANLSLANTLTSSLWTSSLVSQVSYGNIGWGAFSPAGISTNFAGILNYQNSFLSNQYLNTFNYFSNYFTQYDNVKNSMSIANVFNRR